MQPIDFAGRTNILKGPEGMEDCQDLPVQIEQRGRYPVFSSLWKPSPEEIEALVAGKAIRLEIYSTAQPPVSLFVVD